MDASYEPRVAAMADLEAANHVERAMKRRTATVEAQVRELQEFVAGLEARLALAEVEAVQFETALAHEEKAHDATRHELRDLRDAFNHQWADRESIERKAKCWDAQVRKHQLDGALVAYHAVTGE